MTTYLERYLNGEHEQVWRELMSLGAKIRREHLYTDALAVARETMSRVRINVEILIDKLTQIGFLFGYDHRIKPLFHGDTLVDRQRDYLDKFLWVRQQPPVFLASKHIDEEIAARDLYFSNQPEARKQFLEEWTKVWPHNMAAYIDEIEQLIGLVPLSVRAWYEKVGGVNFYGYHAGWDALYRSLHPHLQEYRSSPLMSGCDPLMVYPLDEHFMQKIRQEHIPGEIYTFEFAPDRDFKDYYAGSSSPYVIGFPDPKVDARLYPSMTFLKYLRVSLLQWAGFPEMASWQLVPKDDLAFLTQELCPF